MPYASGAYLLGNLAADPKVKEIGETKVAEFAIAVERYVGGGREPRLSFFDCTAFGKTAEFVGNYFKKGRAVFVDAVPEQQRWEKDGQKRSKVVFIVNRVVGLGPKPDQE